MESRIKFKNTVTVEHRRGGELLSRQVRRNLVVNSGLEWLKSHLCNAAAASVAKYIGLSSNASAPAAGDTDLLATVHSANGLERAEGTYASGATGVCTVSKTFTASANGLTVGSAGLYYTAAGAGLFAGVAITSVELQSGDTLTLTWTVTVA